eukprot:186078-Rhodomonas_salina.1
MARQIGARSLKRMQRKRGSRGLERESGRCLEPVGADVEYSTTANESLTNYPHQLTPPRVVDC